MLGRKGQEWEEEGGERRGGGEGKKGGVGRRREEGETGRERGRGRMKRGPYHSGGKGSTCKGPGAGGIMAHWQCQKGSQSGWNSGNEGCKCSLKQEKLGHICHHKVFVSSS